MPGNPEKNACPPLPTRQKYARAFREGVEVVIHKDHGDEIHQMRKRDDGSFEWRKVRNESSSEDAA